MKPRNKKTLKTGKIVHLLAIFVFSFSLNADPWPRMATQSIVQIHSASTPSPHLVAIAADKRSGRGNAGAAAERGVGGARLDGGEADVDTRGRAVRGRIAVVSFCVVNSLHSCRRYFDSQSLHTCREFFYRQIFAHMSGVFPSSNLCTFVRSFSIVKSLHSC